MTTTSFFCRKKALWPFPPITLPRPEPFVNPAPQILQLLCRAARLCATVPTSAVVFRQIPPLFRSPKPSMIMVQRGSGQRRPGSQSRRRRCDRRCGQRRPVQRLCAPRPDLTQPLNKSRIPLPVPASAGMDRGILHEGEKVKKKISEMVSHKRQDTTATVIPCLYLLLFTVLRTLAAGLPVNKKRTRTLSHRESGPGTNCMVEN